MRAKRVMLAVMCTLLVIVMIMTAVLLVRVGSILRGGSGLLNSGSGSSQNNNSTGGSGSNGTEGENGDSSETTPQSTLATEEGHIHEYVVSETMAPTCENMGYDILLCATCGRQSIQNFVDALGHNFGPEYKVEPTCTEMGCMRKECATCGALEERNHQDPLGHEMEKLMTVEPTCQQPGYDLMRCVNCGEEIMENQVPAAEHSDQVIQVLTQPTCTTDGLGQVQCTLCGDVREEILPASGHDYDNWTVGADSLHRACTACGTEETVLRTSLKITNEQKVDMDNGAQIQIWVGTDTQPQLLQYTVCDYLNNGTLRYSLDPARGLVVIYEDATGLTVELVRGLEDPGSIEIGANTQVGT